MKKRKPEKGYYGKLRRQDGWPWEKKETKKEGKTDAGKNQT